MRPFRCTASLTPALALPAALLLLPGCIIHVDGDGAWRGGYGIRSASFDGPRVHGDGVRGSRDCAVDLDGVERVHLCGAIDARIRVCGDSSAPGSPGGPGSPGARVTGDQNILRHVEVERDGDDLVVALEEGYYDLELPLAIDLVVRDLEGVVIAGASAVTVEGIDARAFSVDLRGSGDVWLAGRVGVLEVEVAGSGDVDARSLEVREARVEIRGSGDVDLAEVEDVTVDIFGSGDVTYRGDPVRHDIEVTGSGSVRAVGRGNRY